MDKELITAIVTAIGVIITAYISWKLGRMQLDQQKKLALQSDGTLREVELREDLLILIDNQERKLQSQEDKIERLDLYVEQTKELADELKRANLNLTIENQRLRRRIEESEAEIASLRTEVEKLKKDSQ